MAQTIKIKRSTGSAAPSTLASGELAYSKGSDTFYIGDPSAANTPIAVGGAIKNNAGTPVLATGITAAEIRTLIDVDQAGTDNSAGTNITVTEGASTVTIASSTGTNDSIAAATPSLAGVMTATDKTKLDGIAAGAQVNVATNLGNSATDTSLTITSSTGNNTNLPAATTTTWGVMTDEDKTKLDGIESGAQVNVGTNITVTEGASTVTIASSTGSDDSIAAATASLAGVMTATDKSKLDGIESSADVTDATNVTSSLVAATAITSGDKTTIQSNLGVDPAGTDNSTNVTLDGTLDYLTISGQTITRNAIDLSTDVTGSLPNASVSGLGALATLNSVNAATITDNSVGAAELNVTGNGTAGQALVSDGDGTMSWSTISVTDNNVNEANLRARLADLTENVTIGDATDVTVTTSGDLVVTGDLTVSGTTTTVNTETILLADNIITVNSNYTGSAPTENGGIEVERGTLANTALRWNETNDNWEFTNDGSTYQTIYSFNPDDTAFNIGANATSTGTSSVAIGSGADATATGALSIGVDSAAGGNNSVAVGANANANNTNNVAVGYNSNAGGAGASSNVAIGGSATTNGSTRSIAIGDGADVASSSYSVAVGSFASASSTYSTAIGYTATADGIYSIGIGRDAQATGANTIVINASGATQTHSTAGEVFIGTDDGQITYDATNGWQFVEDAGGTPVTYDLSDFGTGTVTSISVASPDGSISGTGTITTSGTFNLEVATIDGGTY